MRTGRVAIAAVLLLVATAFPAGAVDDTWVAIGGPRGWPPAPGYTLEIGHHAWKLPTGDGGGVTTVAITTPTVVRVRRLSDCAPVVRFDALPGHMYHIRFAANGSAKVEELETIDSGPALAHPTAPLCPALPDTATATPSPAPEPANGLPVLALAAGLLAAVVVLLRPARHAR